MNLKQLKINKMEYNHIIKDERGKLRIQVFLLTDRHYKLGKNGECYRYDVTTWHTAPRKRSEIISHGIATDAEILEAKTNLWKSIKP